MKIRTQQCGAVVVIRPDGPLVNGEVDELRKGLEGAIYKNLGRIVLDVSTVPFVDSKGLECLVEITRELAQSGKPLKVCAPDQTIRDVLEVTGVSSEFELFEEVTSAVRSFL